MEIKIWGCRGSIPSTGPEKMVYGSNTSCVGITHENTCIILDGGSGILRLNESLPKHITHLTILLTHLHLDHILGLGFFPPFYNPKMTIDIWGPASSKESLKHRLRRYFSPPIFPVRLSELPCKGEIFEIDNSKFKINDFTIYSEYICHPGPTVGYRVEQGGSSIAYLPDHEPALGSANFPNDPGWTSGYQLAKEVDLLLHDAQYKNTDYKKHMGWGHSCMKDAIDFGIMARAKKLLLFHHDPIHSDDQLEKMLVENLPKKEMSMLIELAQEGKSYQLNG